MPAIDAVFQSTPSGGKATVQPGPLTGTIRFQSTPSGGKATAPPAPTVQISDVSIHAFRGEGDLKLPHITAANAGFQSTPSGGKATSIDPVTVTNVSGFQSTPSGGKATSAQ